MDALIISLVAFACIFGGTLVGMALRDRLPEHHLSDESKDAVKLGTGMIATLAALVLGLLIASAKGTFDTMNSELRQTGAKIVLLDRVMAQYGVETTEARNNLRNGVATALHRIWPDESRDVEVSVVHRPENAFENLQDELRQLTPRDDAQRWLKSRALQVSGDISEMRWILFEQIGQGSIPAPFLVVLVCWLTVIFATFGLFSPRNATVIIVLFICALSASAALFLILELDQPYQGLIRISSAPLQNALMHLGK